jgi:ParB family transcriptional regulator, chromosome partitioning protein
MTTTTIKEAESTFSTALDRRNTRPQIAAPIQKHLIGRRKDNQAFTLDAGRIRVDVDQVRKNGKSADDTETQELARLIAELGVMNPLTVRYIEADDIYEIVAGERRFLAMTRVLGMTEIPVRIVEKGEQDIVWLQIHENIHRKELDPLEMSEAIRRVIANGMSADQVAERLKKSVSYVQKFITIGDKLTTEAREELESYPEKHPGKKLGLDVAYEIATVPAASQAELSKAVVEENLPRSETRARAGAIKQTAAIGKPKRVGRPRSAVPFTKTYRASNGASVTVEFKNGKPADGDATIVAALRDVITRLE